MFATSGYFKGVDCPYFKSGLCERPYCHFRHVKKDDSRDVGSSLSSLSSYGGSRPSSPIDSNLGVCSGPTGSKPMGASSLLTKTGPSGSTSTVAKLEEEYSVDNGDPSEGPSYEPTPKYEVAGPKNRRPSSECVYRPGGPAIEVDEYEPDHIPGSKPDTNVEYKPGSVPKFTTPAETYEPTGIRSSIKAVSKIMKPVSKATARKRRANPPEIPDVIPEYVPSTVAQYNPTPIKQLKKMKKTSDTDLEYDPVNNFMCNANEEEEEIGEVVYVPTKRPKMDDDFVGADTMDNVMCMDLDEFGDSDDARFSSDNELNESELIMDSGRYESPREEDSNDEEVSEILFVKPFFKDSSLPKSDTTSKSVTTLSENELKHPVLKQSSSQKPETVDNKTKEEKPEQNDKAVSKSKEKSEKAKSSSHSSSQKSSSKDSSSGKTSDSSKHKDSPNSKTKSSNSHSSKSSTGKSSDSEKQKSSSSSKHSEKKSSSGSSSEKKSSNSSSSEKKSSNSSSSSNHKSSKHNEKDKEKKKDSESDKTKDSSKSKDSSRSSSSEKRKSDSHKSHHSSPSKHRSSSRESSHKNDKDSKEKTRDKSKDSSSHKSSSNSSKSHSQSSKSSSKSEKENKSSHEKSKSSSKRSSSGSRSKDKNLADINVDLFGSDSELEESDGTKKNGQSKEMTDAELAMFLEESDFESDNDTFEECLKIFKEDAPKFSKSSKTDKMLQKDVNQSKESEPPKITIKKRVAHTSDTRPSRPTAPKVATVKPSAAQVMHNRIVEMQRRALEAAEARKAVVDAEAAKASSSNSNMLGKRQAHVPKLKSAEDPSLNDRTEDKRTLAITANKGQKRTAHAPTISNVKRPTIPSEFGAKVPTNIRQRYLNLIIDECLKICKTEEEAYKRGQEEETAVYKRATNKNIYLRVAVNTIKRLRELAKPSPNKTSPSKNVKQSHEAMLAGKNATKTTYTLHRSGGAPKAHTEDFKGAELYQRMSKYVMTEDQLKENGYPRVSPEGGSKAAFFRDRNDKDVILKDHEKNCVRCGKRFIVFPNGTYNREEECIYHWGKAWKKRVDRALVTSYNCCGGDLDAEGCQVCKFHVYESNKAQNVTGYMRTIPSSPPIDGDYGVYAMDCEMVYTKGGMELARVTVIDSVCKPVYEALVKPDFPVIDYNTRFSGLTETDLSGVTTTLRDVQAVLLSLFTDKTILIGHSLESDLVSVKIIHNTVVDTSIVFPHRLGLPYKRALRNLMSDFLKKIIQDDVGGHDSQEDALACLQLMQWKLKEDAKKEIRRV